MGGEIKIKNDFQRLAWDQDDKIRVSRIEHRDTRITIELRCRVPGGPWV
jgi:hypothetical protein